MSPGSPWCGLQKPFIMIAKSPRARSAQVPPRGCPAASVAPTASVAHYHLGCLIAHRLAPRSRASTMIDFPPITRDGLTRDHQPGLAWRGLGHSGGVGPMADQSSELAG